MDNFFLRHFGPEGPPDEVAVPGRVYARVDKIEILDEGPRVLLEAIDSDWFDEEMPTTGSLPAWWRSSWPLARIFVIEVNVSDFPLPQGTDLVDDDADETDEARDGKGDGPGEEWRHWFTLELSPLPGAALLYANLFAAGRRVTITSAMPTSRAEIDRLAKAFVLDGYLTDKGTIDRLLASIARVDLAAVYDVGQGSGGAACDLAGVPLLYLDLGGGVLAHAPTFPPALSNVCTTCEPPVVLSHWDWDHWSSGNRFGETQGLTWLAPLQKVGAVHAAFAGKLGSRLLVWPSGLASIQRGQIGIIKCTGGGRNGSGLAVEVSGPQGEDPILFPGDARYTSIPGVLANGYTSIVAAHHGADMRLKQAPGGPGHSHCRFAYSYGKPNNFGHPRVVTEQIHHGKGWSHKSQGGAAGIERHTCVRGSSGLGHIALGWAVINPLPSQPCGGKCNLQLQQS